MLDISGAYATAMFRAAVRGGCIVKIITATGDPFYASNIAFQHPPDLLPSDVQLTPVLQSVTAFTEKVDWQTRRLSFPSTTITLMNVTVADILSPTMCKRLDQIVNAGGNLWEHAVSVSIYLALDEYAGYAEAVWLEKFSGPITDIKITPSTITIEAASNGRKYDYSILTDKLEDLTDADVPSENTGKYVPILYGSWNENFNNDNYYAGNIYGDRNDPFAGNGLAKALAYKSVDGFLTYALANHECNSVSKLLMDAGSAILAWNDNASGDVGDPTLPARFGTTSANGIIYFPLIAIGEGDPWPPYTGGPNMNFHVTSPASATDGLLNTYLRIYDGQDQDFGGDIGQAVMGYAPLRAAHDDLFREAILTSGGGRRTVYAGIYRAVQQYSGTVKIYPNSALYYGIGSGGNMFKVGSSIQFDQMAWAWSTIGVVGDGDFDLDLDEDSYSPLIIVWRCAIAGGDTVPENDLVWIAYEFLAQIVVSPMEQSPVGWAAAEGKVYGSWIDASGRFEGGAMVHPGTGALIEHPAGIIESIVRDYATDVIDTDTFDDNYGWGGEIPFGDIYPRIRARLQLTTENNPSINQIIQTISEQSVFACQWDARGRLRAINILYGNSALKSAERLIHYSWIKNGDIVVGKTAVYANRLIVHCRYHPEKGVYRTTFQLDDADSQAEHGIIAAEVHWPNVSARYDPDATGPLQNPWADAAYLGRVLVGDPDADVDDPEWGYALWSRPHKYVEFTIIGFAGTDLEVGDHITFDAESCDPHLELFGDTWEDTHFMIVELQHGCAPDVYTKIVAIDLGA